MNNKNPKTDIGVQAEDLKSKTAKPLEKSYLYQGLMTADWALSPLVLGLNMWATTIWIYFCIDPV